MRSGNPTPIVLVHGAWHGSWCWSAVAAHLFAAGRPAVAVDLAGHGLAARRPDGVPPACSSAEPARRSAVADVTLGMAAERLVGQVELIGGGTPVTVVAHSMGGSVLTRVAELRPDLVTHAIYLAAFMPASDLPVAHYAGAPENDGELISGLLQADPMQIGAFRLDVSGTADHPSLRAAFYADVDPVTAHAAVHLLTPDTPADFAVQPTTLTATGWGAVRRSYLMCSLDMAIRPPLQQLFVTQADAAFPENPTQVLTLRSSHSPFLSMPAELAAAIVRADAGAPIAP